jgi:2-polyprenyl-3-methyl-5-hydroxy-6-metoxy-1,4-benzoquinol methylase
MITDQEIDKLILEIQSRYDVGPRYIRTYLQSWVQPEDDIHSLKDILNLPPPRPMWFDYSMSTNWRGKMISDLLASHLPKSAHRYLDVGCGYGGFLVAFAKFGMEVCGIEIDQQRIQFAEANCLDHDLKDCVLTGNILDETLVARLGGFDVITCVDVIEHVLDVPKALLHITELLNHGGILMLEIPNKNSLGFVVRDGHLELFGITLLDRNDAIKYHSIFFNYKYDISDYYGLDFYHREIEMLGCKFDLIGTIPTHSDLFPYMWLNYKRYRAEQYPKLPSSLKNKIRSQFIRYFFMLAGDNLRHIGSRERKNIMQEKFLVDFWQILVTKNAS